MYGRSGNELWWQGCSFQTSRALARRYSLITPRRTSHLPRVALRDGVLGRTASRGRYMYLRGDIFEELDIPKSLQRSADRR